MLNLPGPVPRRKVAGLRRKHLEEHGDFPLTLGTRRCRAVY